MPAVLRYKSTMHDGLPEPTLASTAITTDVLVERTAAGNVANATAASTTIVGISRQPKAVTDTSTDPIMVDHLLKEDRFVMETSATPTAAMVGDLFNLTDADTVNVGGVGTQVRMVEKLPSSAGNKAVFVCVITER